MSRAMRAAALAALTMAALVAAAAAAAGAGAGAAPPPSCVARFCSPNAGHARRGASLLDRARARGAGNGTVALRVDTCSCNFTPDSLPCDPGGGLATLPLLNKPDAARAAAAEGYRVLASPDLLDVLGNKAKLFSFMDAKGLGAMHPEEFASTAAARYPAMLKNIHDSASKGVFVVHSAAHVKAVVRCVEAAKMGGGAEDVVHCAGLADRGDGGSGSSASKHQGAEAGGALPAGVSDAAVKRGDGDEPLAGRWKLEERIKTAVEWGASAMVVAGRPAGPQLINVHFEGGEGGVYANTPEQKKAAKAGAVSQFREHLADVFAVPEDVVRTRVPGGAAMLELLPALVREANFTGLIDLNLKMSRRPDGRHLPMLFDVNVGRIHGDLYRAPPVLVQAQLLAYARASGQCSVPDGVAPGRFLTGAEVRGVVKDARRTYEEHFDKLKAKAAKSPELCRKAAFLLRKQGDAAGGTGVLRCKTDRPAAGGDDPQEASGEAAQQASQGGARDSVRDDASASTNSGSVVFAAASPESGLSQQASQKVGAQSFEAPARTGDAAHAHLPSAANIALTTNAVAALGVAAGLVAAWRFVAARRHQLKGI